MNVNQNVNPLVAVIFIAVIGVSISLVFLAVGERASARVGSYFLESDQQGNLSVQMDHILMRITSKGEMVSSFDLREFWASNVMGNIAYFSNGDFIFRSGERESGIKSYFSLAQIPKPKILAYQSQRVVEKLDTAEQIRKEWVKHGLDVKSGLNRCNPISRKCSVFVGRNVPWRYRVFIDEKNENVYFSEGTKHQVKILSLDGHTIGQLPSYMMFPKRVRAYEGGYYVVDTNNHRLVFFDSASHNYKKLRDQNIVPEESDGRKWPIDAVYFNEHWWVVNADRDMINAHLLKFDKEWSFVERVSLPDGADPFDMNVFNGTLVVSDIHLGHLYTFASSNSGYSIQVLENIAEYITYLGNQRRYFDNIVNGTTVFMVLFVLGFLGCLIWKEKSLNTTRKKRISGKSLNVITQMTPEKILLAEASFHSVFVKIAKVRKDCNDRGSAFFKFRQVLKFCLNVVCYLGLLTTVFFLLPFGLCKVNYVLCSFLLFFFLSVILFLKNEKKISDVVGGWVIRAVADVRTEHAFRHARRAIPFNAHYLFKGSRVSYTREKDGHFKQAWSKPIRGQYYCGDGVVVTYRLGVIYPELLFLVDSPEEIVKYLKELGLSPGAL